jgi:recombination protein RecA
MAKDTKTPTLASVEQAVRTVRERFGESALMRMGERKVSQTPVVPTGSLALDLALGCGGYPRGRIIEVYGPESSGKTTLALHAIANVQREGRAAAIIDAEHALDPGYAKAVGVNVEELLLSQPDNGEQGLEIADELVRTGKVGVVVVDSVAALVPQVELDGDMGAQHIGLQARLMSQALRKLTAVAARTETIIIFINQIRHKVGVIFGSPETQPGGNALKFYASVRLDIRRREKIAGQGTDADPIGNITEVTVKKNKMAPPFKSASFDIIYGCGIDRHADLLQTAVALGVVEKSGSWYSFGGERIGQGGRNAVEALAAAEATAASIEKACREKIRQ